MKAAYNFFTAKGEEESPVQVELVQEEEDKQPDRDPIQVLDSILFVFFVVTLGVVNSNRSGAAAIDVANYILVIMHLWMAAAFVVSQESVPNATMLQSQRQSHILLPNPNMP